MDRRMGAILAVVVSELCFRLAYRFLCPDADPLVFTLGVRAAQVLLILGTALGSSGIKARSVPRELLVGAGAAAVFGASVILADALSRAFLEGGALGLAIARLSVQDPLVFFLAGCLVGPFAEELFFRGLVYTWLRDRMPVLPAVVVSALFFAVMHGFFSPVQLAGGLLFAGIYEWRRSVWAPWVVHAAGNFGIWVLPWILPWW